jgi:retinol dehydrogenase-12/retinol dehydrogenase-13
MRSKLCVITGCNSGIGKETAIELAKKGSGIVMLVRASQKSQQAFEEIKRESGSENVVQKYVDLTSLRSIKRVADEMNSEFKSIDVLINNAGIYKRKYDKTMDDYEMTIAVNYIAPFVLTNHLLPLLRMTKNTRIINLTSELYKKGNIYLESRFSPEKFKGDKAYADSKLLMVYFTKELAKHLEGYGITVNCVHPGVVGTDVFREYPVWFAKVMNRIIPGPEEGAKPSVFLASSEEVSETTGKYFYKTTIKETKKVANDADLSKKIWKKTEELTGVKYY